MDEKRRKELFAKRKYFSEHPEEAHEEYCKRNDGVSTIPINKNDNSKISFEKRGSEWKSTGK